MMDIEGAQRFHGHMCPGLAMGIRVAELALQEIGPHAGDEEVVAIVETDNCAVDAIQYFTGCTFGKGNLMTFGLGDAWPLRAWARTTFLGGWDMPAGLPRSTRQAVEPGAVYLFYLPPDSMPFQTLLHRLAALELAGVGAERERGYGQVTVCAPFHYAGWRP